MSSEQNYVTIPNLNYSTTYSFSIRALSSSGEEYNSDWWGQENISEYRKYLSMQTSYRYSIPFLMKEQSSVTDRSVKLHIDRKVDESAENYQEWAEHFNIMTDAFGNKVWKVDYCVIEFSRNNRVTPKPADIKIHLDDSDFDSDGTATLDINGLRANSLYNAYTMDSSILSEVDATYNTILFRTKDSSTAINNVEATPKRTTDDKTYNLAGQEVNRMTNGVYIKNGKKIICNPSK